MQRTCGKSNFSDYLNRHSGLIMWQDLGCMALDRGLNLALILDSSLVCFTVVAAAGRLYFGCCTFIQTSHIRYIMELLLKNRLRLNRLEFRSEIGEALGAAIRTAPGIGESITTVL